MHRTPRIAAILVSMLTVGSALFAQGTAVETPAVAQAPVETTPTLGGLTGLIRVPTAEILPDGELRAMTTLPRDIASPGIGGTTAYSLGIGFLPQVEGVLSLGSEEMGRDLTAHVKWQVRAPGDGWPALAVGLTDIKRTQPSRDPVAFAVATQRFDRDRLAVTLGASAWGQSGLLAGTSYRLTPWLDLQGEYDSRRINYGIAARAARGLWIRAAHSDAGMTYSASYHVPLAHRTAVTTAAASPNTIAVAPPPAVATAVQDALVTLGFEDVQVALAQGPTGTRLQATIENRRYTVNALDGMAAALSVLAQAAPADVQVLALTVTQRNVPVVSLETGLDAYRRYQADAGHARAFAAQLRVRLFPAGAPDGTVLAVTDKRNRSYGHTDLLIGPGIRTQIGTETDTFTYGLSVQPEWQAPIAKGLTGSVRWNYPLVGPLVENDPQRVTTDRAVLGYLFQPAPGMLGQVVAGRFPQDRDGVAVEWAQPCGRRTLWHAVAAGLHEDGGWRQPYLLGEVWYLFPQVQTQVRLFGGQFLDEDRGVGVDVRRFFGDIQVGVGVRSTEVARTFELRLAVPLSPARQPSRPATLRVRAADYVDYRFRSRMATSGGPNDLASAETSANELTFGLDLINTVMSRNRLLPDYLARYLR